MRCEMPHRPLRSFSSLMAQEIDKGLVAENPLGQGCAGIQNWSPSCIRTSINPTKRSHH
jgi:hypothetical protein